MSDDQEEQNRKWEEHVRKLKNDYRLAKSSINPGWDTPDAIGSIDKAKQLAKTLKQIGVAEVDGEELID